MPFDTIEKTVANAGPAANLGDYETARRDFTWGAVRAELAGLPGGGVNIAYEALDRHLAARRGDRRALRWIGKDNRIRDLTYAALAAAANRFANVLKQLGIGKGDRVFCLAGGLPELYIAALTRKNQWAP